MILRWLSRLFSRPTPPPEPPTPEPPQRYYAQVIKRTPNISKGRVIKPTHIILHHTGGSYVGSVSWCLNPKSRVSYHCIIARNGKRTVMALPTQRTWHAGVSSWQGRRDVNSWSIGIAWEGDTYATPLTEDAVASAVEYLLPLVDEFDIDPRDILRHADVAPKRKNDCSPRAHRVLVDTLQAYL